MNVEKLPKLPIYRPKGVWTDVNDVPKQQALIWAYNYYSTATDKTRRFMVNAVAAIFEWQLIQNCSEKCANEGPCPNCGHWEWVSEPMAPKEEMDMNEEWRAPFYEKGINEHSVLINHPEMNWIKGPGSLITKEGMRCAVSVILATKADYWGEGPIKMEEINHPDQLEVKDVKKILGKHASSMVQDLYPAWNLDDAAEAVLIAGLWANTRNIIAMVGDIQLPPCISLWDVVPKSKLILSPCLKKSFTSYPAGTEVLLEFLAIAKDLVTTPLLLYFPNARDLTVLLRAKESVKANPFNYHVCARELGLNPLNEHNIYSIFGRLGAYYLSKAKATNQRVTTLWCMEKIKENQDFDQEFAEICEAYYGLKATTMESACVLLQAEVKNNDDVMQPVLAEYQVAKTEMQERILATIYN